MNIFDGRTNGELRDILADLDRVVGTGSKRQQAKEALIAEIEEELRRRQLEEMAQ